MKEAATWLRERLQEERERFFRLGPAPLAPRTERRLAQQDPAQLADALRGLAVPPPKVSLSHMAFRFPPVAQFLERFRAVLRRRRVFDFDGEVAGLSRVEQAVAFLALLELRKSGEVALAQAAPLPPSVSRVTRTKGYPRGPFAPPDLHQHDCRHPHRRPRAHHRGASRRRLAAAHRRRADRGDRGRRGAHRDGDRAPARALRRGQERDRARARVGRLRVPRLARGGRRVRAPVRAARRTRPVAGGARDARDRRVLGPVSRPDIARVRGVAADSAVASLVERGLVAEAGRESGPGGAVRYRGRCSSSASSGSTPSRSCLASTPSAARPTRSASGCSPSPRHAPPDLVRERGSAERIPASDPPPAASAVTLKARTFEAAAPEGMRRDDESGSASSRAPEGAGLRRSMGSACGVGEAVWPGDEVEVFTVAATDGGPGDVRKGAARPSRPDVGYGARDRRLSSTRAAKGHAASSPTRRCSTGSARTARGRTLMTSVCTGSLVFAAAGLLRDRPRRRTAERLDMLAELDPTIELRPDDRFVDSGEIVTRPASRPASTWRSTSSRGSTRWSGRARSGATSSTTPSRRCEDLLTRHRNQQKPNPAARPPALD